MMLKNFARTMVCISLVVAAAPSFAGHQINSNDGTLHANENFGGGSLVVSVGNFSSNLTYDNVLFQVAKCTDSTLRNCVLTPVMSMGNIDPGKTDRIPVPAPPGFCYYTIISADGGGEIISFPGYCVGR
jgi:hypothetical protein